MKSEVDAKARFKKNLEEIKGFSRFEKKQWALKKKELGTIAYKQKNIPEAINLYNDGMLGLVFSDNESENLDMRRDVQLPLLNNLAACFIELKVWSRAAELCNISLKIDPAGLKPLFRLGLCLFNMGKTVESEKTLLDVVARCTAIIEGRRLNTAMVEESVNTLKDFVERSNNMLTQITAMKKKESAFARNMFKKAGNLYEVQNANESIEKEEVNESETNEIPENNIPQVESNEKEDKNEFVFVSYRSKKETSSWFNDFLSTICSLLRGPCPKRKVD
eukprot:GDKJ01028153.1.p1 GENE.GDKJ01028153.1~~GDKJ01028153.1.p1  ORF type:complete len:313 (+),score=76.27 GDKJ01028153.1:109-939(+)